MPVTQRVLVVAALAAVSVCVSTQPARSSLDPAAARWVEQTLAKMTLDEKIGQLLVTSLDAVFTSADGDAYRKLRHLVRDVKVGGIHIFGSSEPFPALMLNPTYGPSPRNGDPFAAAALLNRLQRDAQVPLLATADFEGGVGWMLNGATRVPRAMAIGATRDPGLAYRAGRLAAEEGRALGVGVDFYPIVDVNSNPRNPIINIRSFGEDVALVSDMASAYVRGVQDGGMIATAKHFPGHGDTATDTHFGLAVIDHPRSRLDAVELPPFRAAIAAGAGAVMSSHIVVPALDSAPLPGSSQLAPATFSRAIVTGVLRRDLQFDGLIYTDSMSMLAVTQNMPPDRAAALAIAAGADQVLHSPDDEAALRGIKAAVAAAEISQAQITRSAERVLAAKARLGLHLARVVDLGTIDEKLGTREHERIADDIAARAITLIKDDRHQVPWSVPGNANVLCLSVIDDPAGWREGAPGRTFLPELKKRWPNVSAVEVSDRTTANEFDLVRALAIRSDAVVAAVYVRQAAGRMDLSADQVSWLERLAGLPKPLVAIVFASPYAATAVRKLPAILLTYEYYDGIERAAVRALAGEAPIGGKLPVSLPDLFPFGHGLERGAH
jgi:beta-N-acetylhexosaminidase